MAIPSIEIWFMKARPWRLIAPVRWITPENQADACFFTMRVSIR
jgi:hypothetical protein